MASTVLGKVVITPRGEYSPDVVYESLDAISYNGSSYLVKKMCIGITPPNTEYFMLLAEKGKDGSGDGNVTAPSITIGTVQTGEPGTDASVTNSGTDTDIVLDFVIPRGNNGDVNFVTFDIKIDTGELVMNSPESGSDISFNINDNGYFEVII